MVMFPETDELSKIISDIIKIVFKRRLVDRVLRLWIEMARGQEFPRRDQIEPSKLGVDWRNCLVIGVQFPVQLSYLVAVGENLSFAHCHVGSLADVPEESRRQCGADECDPMLLRPLLRPHRSDCGREQQAHG